MKTPRFRIRGRNRQGIALLLVLVMATLLAAVAISMVSSQRLDRLASSNYQDGISARALVQNAVDDALRRVGSTNPTTGIFQANGIAPSPALVAVRTRNIITSIPVSGGAALSVADQNSLITKETLDYISPIHRTSAQALARSARWQDLTDSTGAVIGRYTVLLEDQSGLLDINALIPLPAAHPKQRTVTGRDFRFPQAIDASEAFKTDSMGALTWSSSLPTNTKISHYVNAAEVRTFATQATDNETKGNLFTTFSRNPVGMYPDSLTNSAIAPSNGYQRLNLNDPAALTRTAFIDRMNAMGFGDPLKEMEFPGHAKMLQSDILWDSFVDYNDPDSIPLNKYVSNEAVAMLSELLLSVKLESITGAAPGPFTYSFLIDPQFELHFPFVTLPGQDVSCRGDVKWEVKFDFTTNTGGAGSHTLNADATLSDSFGNSRPRLVMSTGSPQPYSYNSSDEVTGITATCTLLSAEVKLGADVVDDIVEPAPYKVTMTIPVAANSLKVWHAEVLDPRVNRTFQAVAMAELSSLGIQPWRIHENLTVAAPPQASPGAVNLYTIEKLNPAAVPQIFDDDPEASKLLAFVRNGEMELVGELGYLPYNAWQTIKLISADFNLRPAHPVSDHFMAPKAFDDIGGYPKLSRGLINPNTSHPEVMAALFFNMPADHYPENKVASVQDPNARVTTIEEARLLAVPIAGLPRSRSFPYLNPSDAFNNPALNAVLRSNPILTARFPSEIQRESIVRNSIELMNTRNQMYQMVVMVQSLRGSMPVSTEKALVHVWRDAVSTPTTGNVSPYPYPYFIQQITYLND